MSKLTVMMMVRKVLPPGEREGSMSVIARSRSVAERFIASREALKNLRLRRRLQT